MNPMRKPLKRSSGRQRRKLLRQLIWPGMLKGERGTTACRMTRVASDDEPRDGTPSRRHHPKFNPWHPADQDRLRDRSRSIREEIGWIEYQGEQVYRTPTHNALASRMLINQLTPHLPKENEEVNVHVKHL
jgi:hypothetical protein